MSAELGRVDRRGFGASTTPPFPPGACRGVIFEEETEKRIAEESTSQNQR